MQLESERLTVEATRSIFRATIWAVRPDCRKDGGENDKNLCHCLLDSFVDERMGTNNGLGRRKKNEGQFLIRQVSHGLVYLNQIARVSAP